MKWIYHESEVQLIYPLSTDRQPVIYWATNHLLERIYFDSYTQEKAVVSFRLFQISAFALKNPANISDCNTDVYTYFLSLICTKMMLHRLTSKKHGRWVG